MEINNLKQSKITVKNNKEKITLPFISIKSPKKGPKIFIIACMHGDEKGSHFVAKTLIKILKNKLVRGEMYFIPLLNPLGYKKNSRFFNKEDLNTIFPVNKNGSLAKKTTYQVFNKIIQVQPDLVLDLHNDWKRSINYVLIDPKTSKTSDKIYNKTIKFGKKLNVPFILDTDNLTGSLSYNLLKNNIPAITIELGDSSLKKIDIKKGTEIILGLLSKLEMINNKLELKINNKIKNKVLVYNSSPLSNIKGKVKFLVSPGQFVKKGQKVAEVHGDKIVDSLYSKEDALILGLTDSSIVKKGEQVVALGIIK